MTTIQKANGKKGTVSPDSMSNDKQQISLKELATRIEVLESQLVALEEEKQQYLTVGSLVNLLTGSLPVTIKVRKKREFTDEERKAIRDRLEAGKKTKQRNPDLKDLEFDDISNHDLN